MGKKKRSQRDLQEVIEQTAGVAVVALEAATTQSSSQHQAPRKRGRPRKIIQKSKEIKGRRAQPSQSKTKAKSSEEEEEDDDEDGEEEEEETKLIQMKKKHKGMAIESATSSHTERGEADDVKQKQKGTSHDEEEEEQQEENPKVVKKSKRRRKGQPRKSSI